MAQAIFASKMQDGISILSRIPSLETVAGKHPTACEALVMFDSGFEKIKRILKNHRPMSLSLMLGIVCGLISLGVGSLLLHFLPYTGSMASTVLTPYHPLSTLFGLLGNPTTPTAVGTPPLAHMIFNAFRVAINQLQISSHSLSATSSHHTKDWHQLYLSERSSDVSITRA